MRDVVFKEEGSEITVTYCRELVPDVILFQSQGTGALSKRVFDALVDRYTELEFSKEYNHRPGCLQYIFKHPETETNDFIEITWTFDCPG